jgi:antitoxin component of MazEF toxin-antitoxin module
MDILMTSEAYVETTLAKWGNSQGLRIPREVCSSLGIEVGAKANIGIDVEHSTLVVHFDRPKRKYHRNRKMTMQEFAAGWQGNKVGEEWGGADIGAEVVE